MTLFLCDVVPMEACDVFLGTLWQFDKKKIHNGLTNQITFLHENEKFVLLRLIKKKV